MTYLLEQKRGLMIFEENWVILTIISELMISCVANIILNFITLNVVTLRVSVITLIPFVTVDYLNQNFIEKWKPC